MENIFLERKKELKTKLLFLYLLNISDLFFTQLLLNTGYFEEANKIMYPIVNTSIAWLVKAGLLLILLLYWYSRSKKSSEIQISRSLKMLNVFIIFYILVNLGHAFCMSYYFFYIK